MCKKTTTSTVTTLTAEEIRNQIEKKEVALALLREVLERCITNEKTDALSEANTYKKYMEEQYAKSCERTKAHNDECCAEEDKEELQTYAEYWDERQNDYYFSTFRKATLKATACDEVANQLLEIILG